MKNYITIISLLFFILPMCYAQKVVHPAVQWSPPTMDFTLLPGTEFSTTVTLTTKDTIRNASIEVVPTLQPFIHIEPTNVDRLDSSLPLSVKINISSTDSMIMRLDGTIHIRIGKRTLPQTLKLSLNIIPPSALPQYYNKIFIKEVASIRVKAQDGANISTFYDRINLIIPAGSLPKDTTITISIVNNPPNMIDGLNLVGTIVDIKPDGLMLSKPAILKLKYLDNDLVNAGVVTKNLLTIFSYNYSSGSWKQQSDAISDTVENYVLTHINHFSIWAIGDMHPDIPPKDLGTPKKGDLVYKIGWFFTDACLQQAWRPGHVAIYTGERVYPGGDKLASQDVKKYNLYNVIESTIKEEGLSILNGVQYSYYDFPNVNETYSDLPKFAGEGCYMGARMPDNSHGGHLTKEQRDAVVEYAETQIGKRYAWIESIGLLSRPTYGLLEGQYVKGPVYNCVGLAEAAYEYAGVNGGHGLVDEKDENGACFDLPCRFPPCCNSDHQYISDALTPSEQYRATVPARYGNIIPTDGLVAYYPFNDNANDESGNGNNGTLIGGITTTTNRFGNNNSAFLFDGSTGYIRVPNSASLQSPSTAISLCGWALLDSYNGWWDHIGFINKTMTSDYGEYHLMYHTYDHPQIYFSINGSPGSAGSVVGAPTDGKFEYQEWYFVVSTWDGDTAKIFVNGKKLRSAPLSGTILPDTNSLLLGLNTPGWRSNFLKGKIDDIRIYNRALNSAEIASLYHEEGFQKGSTSQADKSDLQSLPISYSLSNNYPNPFNPSTSIRYGLPEESQVTLSIFNTLGQRVALLVEEKQEAGYHEVMFNGETLPSGVYFYRLQAGQYTETKKLLLMK